jgi:hypothetical protein
MVKFPPEVTTTPEPCLEMLISVFISKMLPLLLEWMALPEPLAMLPLKWVCPCSANDPLPPNCTAPPSTAAIFSVRVQSSMLAFTLSKYKAPPIPDWPDEPFARLLKNVKESKSTGCDKNPYSLNTWLPSEALCIAKQTAGYRGAGPL